jgi:hypothetical protein
VLVDDRLHDRRLHHVGEPVGVEQVDVVGLDAVLDDVGRNDGLDAERPGDEVLVQRIAGLFRSELAAVDLLLEERVVVRELLELLAAQPIAARVPDVADAHAIAAEHDGHERRPHAGALGPRLRDLVDPLVRLGDLLLKEERRVGEPRRDVHLRQLAIRVELGHHAAAHDLDRDAARDLPRVVAPHAVGEHGNAGIGVDEHRILVVRPDHPRMGQHGSVERDAFGHGRGWAAGASGL